MEDFGGELKTENVGFGEEEGGADGENNGVDPLPYVAGFRSFHNRAGSAEG